MKYLLATLILIAGCSQPKFHYNDTVRINSGFYQNHEGKLNSVYSTFSGLGYRYYFKNKDLNIWVDESELELVDAHFKKGGRLEKLKLFLESWRSWSRIM